MNESAEDSPERDGIPSSVRKIYTVTELNRKVRTILESGFPVVWIEGEISGFKKHHSGHIYFTLKDETSVLKAVFFSRYNQDLRFELKDGLKVVCFGKISVYEVRGEYQIYVERIDPKGLGELQLALEQLKAKLTREGIFDPARKRPIPPYPRKVGIVTSPTGAVIRDIMNVMGRRFRGVNILLCPVKVQGEGSAGEIAHGIEVLNGFKDIDVLIVGRGGGSFEDLWAFNEERVVRAIYNSRIPVISAVGHEVDWTLADFVADLRAPTPSAAAELVTKSGADLEIKIGELSRRARNAVRGLWLEKKEQAESLASSYAFKQPMILIDRWSQGLDEISKRLVNRARQIFFLNKSRFGNAAGKLGVLSPVAVLARGYSVTFSGKGKMLKNVSGLKKGDALRTYFGKGAVESEVRKVLPAESLEDAGKTGPNS